MKVEEGRRQHEEEGWQNRSQVDRGTVSSAAQIGSFPYSR